MKEITPVFVFSSPRSGSTLLQRILAAHEQVATASEPWLLLPFFYARRSNGVFAEYNQNSAHKALYDFLDVLPEGRADYRAALRRFALRLYRRAAGSRATHFVDKTPRYSLIADQIIPTFPQGKFIFLWRNPLAVAASIMRTWGRSGHWNLDRYKVDLYKGLANLLETYRHTEQGLALKYEDLVTHPEQEMARVFAELELPFDRAVLSDFSQVGLAGRMGDPTGTKRYDRITASTTDRWKSAFDNPLRKRWARMYLRWLGPERLALMGYDGQQLIEELEATPNRMTHLFSDVLRMGRGLLRPWVEPSVQRAKFRRLPQWTHLVEHV